MILKNFQLIRILKINKNNKMKKLISGMTQIFKMLLQFQILKRFQANLQINNLLINTSINTNKINHNDINYMRMLKNYNLIINKNIIFLN